MPRILREVLTQVLDDASNDLQGVARLTIQDAQCHWRRLDERLEWCEQRIAAHLKDDELAQQAMKLIGVGPVTESAVVATVGDMGIFKNGAQFGAWIGLTPRQHSSGGKNNLSGITKRGDSYLRTLLIQGAKAPLIQHKRGIP